MRRTNSKPIVAMQLGTNINRPVWSPDGRRIAFGAANGIYLLEACSTWSEPELLYDGGSVGRACFPSWSPDGHWIAFTLLEYRFKLGDCLGNIHLIDVNGSRHTNLTRGMEISAAFPAWSPDGETIAYLQGGSSYIQGDVYLMSAGGTVHGPVTATGGQIWAASAWSPDGSMVAFSGVAASGQFKLFASSVANYVPVQLTFGPGDDLFPAWAR
jgi:Tol biopolymer transport system component